MSLCIDDEDGIKTCEFDTLDELKAGIKIGSKVLEFCENRRVYRRATEGQIWGKGGPIYRGHFNTVEVIGETSRSWLLAGWAKTKISKKTLMGIYSNECADRSSWLKQNSYEITQVVQRKLRDDYVLARYLADYFKMDLPVTGGDSE